MSSIFKLPIDIFVVFQDYLKEEEYRNLVNCSCNQYVQELKQKTCYFTLSEEFSNEFWRNDEFRLILQNRISNPSKQISVAVNARIIHDYSEPLKYLNALTVTNSSEIQELMGFEKIEILTIKSSGGALNLHGLAAIKSLTLCEIQGLEDLSPLSTLTGLSFVRVELCPQVTDLNALRNVQTIEARFCPITDIGIQHLSCSSLRITNSPYIHSIDHLKTLQKLHLERCFEIQEINDLPKLTHLTLEFCPKFNKLQKLTELKYFKIFNCENFHYPCLNIISTQLINLFIATPSQQMNLLPTTMDSSRFQSLKKFQLFGFSHVINLNCLSTLLDLLELEIIGCEKAIFEIQLFQQIKSFQLQGSKYFKGIFYSLPNLKKVIFQSCPRLETIHGLKGNNNLEVIIHDCDKFQINDEFYLLVLRNMNKLTITADIKQLSSTTLKKPSFLDEINQMIIPSNIRNKSLLRMHGSYTFSSPLLLNKLFTSLQCLILFSINKLTNLSFLAKADCFKIPILFIYGCCSLNALYPEDIIAEHKRVILIGCPLLRDFSSLSSVRRVSIGACRMTSFRQLIGCERIDYDPIDSSVHEIEGWNEVKSKVFRFSDSEQMAWIS